MRTYKIFLLFSLLINHQVFGQNWEYFGSTEQEFELVRNYPTFDCLKFGPNGVPYICFADGFNVISFSGKSWEKVGGYIQQIPGSTSTEYFSSSMEFSPSGNLYVATHDYDRVKVFKLVNHDWLPVGSNYGIKIDKTSRPILKFNPKGVPFVACQNVGSNKRLTVLSFDGINWNNVGSENISDGATENYSLAIDSIGIPYVSYSDIPTMKLFVKSFDGVSWNSVGQNIYLNSGQAYSNNLVFSPDNKIFIGFQDSLFGKTTVLSFNGINWTAVGSKITDTDNSKFKKLMFSPSGIPVLLQNEFDNSQISIYSLKENAWAKTDSSLRSEGILSNGYGLNFNSNGIPFITYFDYKMHTLSFNGINWREFGDNELSKPYISNIQMKTDNKGTTYISYCDFFKFKPNDQNSINVNVISVNGENWGRVGLLENNGYGIDAASLCLHPNGTPFLAFKDPKNNFLTSVISFDGFNWNKIAPIEGLTQGRTGIQSLAISPTGTPFIAFQEGSYQKLNVSSFNGSNWGTVGKIDDSVIETNNHSLTFDQNGIPFVAFTERYRGFSTVLSFDGINWGTVVTRKSIYLNIAFSPQNDIYLSFYDDEKNATLILTFDGINWNTIGEFPYTYISNLTFDLSGKLFIAGRKTGMFMSYTRIALCFDGQSWQELPTLNMESLIYEDFNISFNPISEELLIAYNISGRPLLLQRLPKQLPKLIIKVNDAAKTYGQPNPEFSYTVTGLLYNENIIVDYFLDGLNIIPSVAGISLSDYNLIKIQGKLTINKIPLTITSFNAEKNYGDPNPPFGSLLVGSITGDTFTIYYEVEDTSIVPLVFCVNIEYYSLIINKGKLKINPIPLTITALNSSIIYGNSNPEFKCSITGSINNDLLIVTYLVENNLIKPSVSGKNLKFYNLSTFPGILTTTKAPLTVTAYNLMSIYGQSPHVFNGTILGLQNNDEIIVSYGLVGNTILPNAMGEALINYSLTTVAGILTIKPAPLTIIAFDKNIDFNQSNPIFNGTIIGLVFNDHINVTYELKGDSIIPVASGIDLMNYDLTTIAGKLNILNSPQTIYGFSMLPTLTVGGGNYTISGVSASSQLPITFEATDENIASINDNVLTPLSSGTTTITASQLGNANYLPTSVSILVEVVTINGTNTNISSEKASNEKSFTLYPNPNDGSFTLNSKFITFYQIYSLEGVLVKNGEAVIGTNSIATQLPKGFYILKIRESSAKLLIE